MSKKHRVLCTTLIFLLIPALAGAVGGKVLDRAVDGTPRILGGDLGTLDGMSTGDKAALGESARGVLQDLLARDFGAAGNEEMVAAKVVTDELGAVHVRFTQELNGLPVAGAAMVLHAHADGKVFGVNGEFVRGGDLPVTPSLDAETAIGLALGKSLVQRLAGPDLTYVLGSDGRGYLAWQVTVGYRNEQGPQRDLVFADAETGKLVARHPQFKYARALETRDCNNKTKNCSLVSTSPNPINTGDGAIDAAHNFAIATYDYYSNNHGRDSIDDNGMTLISRAHYSKNYNNAFWDGTQMTYGDGDGTTFIPLSQDADVVAHELTHGVTERTSGLIYQNESGALNEAWSDIFGAGVDRQEGASVTDTWLLGEDIYTPAISGDALRVMDDPAAAGDVDYYPDRFTGTSDNGGVHTNSGIANLAFALLVEGGTHPRGKTSVNVPALSANFDTSLGIALDIFYAANVACMTPSSNFAAARFCTADVHGGSDAAAVHLAWDAVGVPNDPPEPPPPPIELTDGVTLGSQSGDTGEIQQYTLDVASGSTVTCTTVCNNGDADLYLRFGADAEANPNSTVNECGSFSSNSNESCTTGPAPSATTLFAAVHAFTSYTNLSITCTSGSGGSCTPNGGSCSTGSDCCSGNCSGGKPSTRVCF
jgi:vibriolysin